MGLSRQITFLTTGILPVPATSGGAVEGLVEQLLQSNESSCQCDFKVISIWTEEAEKASKLYSHTDFIFLHVPKFIEQLDCAVFRLIKKIARRRNVSAYRYIFQRLWFLRATSSLISKNDFGTLIIENHPSIYLSLKAHNNYIKYDNRFYYHLHNIFNDAYGCQKIAVRAKAVLSISESVQNSYHSSYLVLVITK